MCWICIPVIHPEKKKVIFVWPLWVLRLSMTSFFFPLHGKTPVSNSSMSWDHPFKTQETRVRGLAAELERKWSFLCLWQWYPARGETKPFFVSPLCLSDRSFLKWGDPTVWMALEDSQIFPGLKKKKKIIQYCIPETKTLKRGKRIFC